jgi:DNA-binding NtrC family response regulator
MSKKTVMICDDDNGIRTSVKSILEKNGFEVLSSVDGDDCMNKLEKKKVDLVLVDVMMPGKPVREIVKEINGKGPKVAYLTMVRVAKAEISEILKHNQVCDFIQKPIDDKEFVNRIKKNCGVK